jgi:hypothetical protein
LKNTSLPSPRSSFTTICTPQPHSTTRAARPVPSLLRHRRPRRRSAHCPRPRTRRSRGWCVFERRTTACLAHFSFWIPLMAAIPSFWRYPCRSCLRFGYL